MNMQKSANFAECISTLYVVGITVGTVASKLLYIFLLIIIVFSVVHAQIIMSM